jgi:CheY-like chemotaxis protein
MVAMAGQPVRAVQILVAEDILANQVLIRGLLEAAGHQVTLVGDGVQAVRAAETGCYDLVFMDLDMPEMDGIAAACAIRALPTPFAAEVPIVALTAGTLPSQEAACRAAGMNDFLRKPCDGHTLRGAVTRWSRTSIGEA